MKLWAASSREAVVTTGTVKKKKKKEGAEAPRCSPGWKTENDRKIRKKTKGKLS